MDSSFDDYKITDTIAVLEDKKAMSIRLLWSRNGR